MLLRMSNNRSLCLASAAIIFIYHITAQLAEKLPGSWDLTFVVVYPGCFLASLVLGVMRIMNFLPNPSPIIPVAISIIGWAVMFIGAILAMRHANLNLHIEIMTDDEVASDPVFRHDLLLCSLSLVGSSLYLVHAWLCYDCWRWDKRVEAIEEEAETPRISDFDSGSESKSESESESDSGMSSTDETEENYRSGGRPASSLPGTSTDRGKPGGSGHRRSPGRGLRLFRKPKKPVEAEPDENDALKTLNEILRRSTVVKQIKVEDEPVELYCCCVDLGRLIKQGYRTNETVHEFQVVHVM